MMLREQGFDGNLTSSKNVALKELDKVVLEFTLKHVSEYDKQDFLQSYAQQCGIENIGNLFRYPIQWKSLNIPANYVFDLEFDELSFYAILKEIKVKRKAPTKIGNAEQYTYELVFHKEFDDNNLDLVFSTFLNRKEENEFGKKVLVDYNVVLKPVESAEDYAPPEDDE